MRLVLLLSLAASETDVKKYYGEGFILSCTIRCERAARRSLNSIQWLRKLDEPQKHDLGLSRIEVNGEWFEKLEMRNDENTHYPAIHTFQKRKCELISKLHFSHATSIETGQYLCYEEPEIHQSYNVQLIENEREQSFVLEMLLSSMLLLVLLLALIITLVQHYHPRSSQNEQNSFLPSSPFPNEL